MITLKKIRKQPRKRGAVAPRSPASFKSAHVDEPLFDVKTSRLIRETAELYELYGKDIIHVNDLVPMWGFISKLVEHRTGIRGGYGFEYTYTFVNVFLTLEVPLS